MSEMQGVLFLQRQLGSGDWIALSGIVDIAMQVKNPVG